MKGADMPDWISEEVTADERYRNSRLAGTLRATLAPMGCPANRGCAWPVSVPRR